MLLVSQFHFVYSYSIVLVVLTRGASFVDVECMFSITGQLLNGKQSSPSAQSADKLYSLYTTISSPCLSMDDMSRLKTKLCNSYLVVIRAVFVRFSLGVRVSTGD